MIDPATAQDLKHAADDLAAQWAQARYAQEQVWAAWAQAGGSMLAILAAYLMGRSEIAATQKAAERERWRICEAYALVLTRQFLVMQDDIAGVKKQFANAKFNDKGEANVSMALLYLPNSHATPISEIATAIASPARDVAVEAASRFFEYRAAFDNSERGFSRTAELTVDKSLVDSLAGRLTRLDSSCVKAIFAFKPILVPHRKKAWLPRQLDRLRFLVRRSNKVAT